MFNDVHLARVSKIQRSADVAKGTADHISRRLTTRNTKEVLLGNNITDMVFVSSNSSRTGDIVTKEVESPDYIQRDNNESDNNISSCSTLDIGKVSG